jgi:tRNA A37 threonylcarbamoyladenosine synthetase subunit TsaC/SUA5/YrdC
MIMAGCGYANTGSLAILALSNPAFTIFSSEGMVEFTNGEAGMSVAAGATARLTSDPAAPEQLQGDVGRLFDAMAAGGIGIVPLDVAYAVVATMPGGIRRIFEAKQRSYEKPSGMFGNWRLSREIHLMDDRKHEMVRELVEQEKIPFSVVAPFRTDHPLLAAVDPFVMQNSSKGRTLDMLLNAGQFHDAIAESSLARGVAVFGSSANLSLTGSKYRYADIDQPIRDAAAIYFDYGQSKYAHKDGLSSTIIDFESFTVIRVGHCFERLKNAFAARFGVTLQT